MSLVSIPLDAVTAEHLAGLIANVPEGRHLDYKRDVYGPTDNDKREFLADISAMANSGGGDIIIGMDEAGGLATSLNGIAAGTDADAEVLRLENIQRTGLQPRIQGLQMRVVPIDGGRNAIVVRIPQSMNAPHRVISQNSNRFWARNSAGKYEPEVEELRTMFLALPALEERIQKFHDERVAAVGKNRCPVRIYLSDGILVLHVIPLGAFAVGARLLTAAELYEDWESLRPPHLGDGGRDPIINFDGLAVSIKSGNNTVGYVQSFRNGIMEGVGIRVITNAHRDVNNTPTPIISSERFEKRVVYSVNLYLSHLRKWGVNGPYAVCVSALGVNGAAIDSVDHFDDGQKIIDRTPLTFHPIIFDNNVGDQQECAKLLRPIFDQLANAGGRMSSNNFDKDGNWTVR